MTYYVARSSMLNDLVSGFDVLDCEISFLLGLICVLIPADTAVKKRVEDVMPIATGHEKEELEAELEVLLNM